MGPGAARAVQQGDVLALGGTLLRLAKAWKSLGVTNERFDTM